MDNVNNINYDEDNVINNVNMVNNELVLSNEFESMWEDSFVEGELNKLYQDEWIDDIELDEFTDLDDEVEMPRLRLSNPYIPFKINGRKVKACIDSGATRTIMSNEYFKQHLSHLEHLIKPSRAKLRSASSHAMNILGEFNGLFDFLNGKYVVNHPIIIYENDRPELLLGNDFTFGRISNILGKYVEIKGLPQCEQNKIQIQYKRKSLPVYSIYKVSIPPHSTCRVACKQQGKRASEDFIGEDLFIDDDDKLNKCLYNVEPTCSTGNELGEVYCVVSNTTDEYINVNPHTYIGIATPIGGNISIRNKEIDKDDQICQIVRSHDYMNENPLSQDYIDNIDINRISDYKEIEEYHEISSGTKHGGLPDPPGFDGLDFKKFNPIADAELSHLNKDQQRKIQNIINKFPSAFAKSDADIGTTDLMVHKINVKGKTPVVQNYRPVAKHYQEPVEKMIKELLALGVISEAKQSSWAANLVVVKKKNTGKLRICCDLRGPNSVSMERSCYPIRNTEISFAALAKSKYITSIDLLAAYWTIKMEPQSSEATAFYGPKARHYKWDRMPFGLAGAPHTYSEVMSMILKEFDEFVYNYFDDVLIYSDTFEEHIEHLTKVIKKFMDAGFKINTKKCKWACTKEMPIEWLGSIVRNGCVLSNPEKTKVIANRPKPVTVKEMQAFLGAVNFHRRHIKNLSTFTVPLNALIIQAGKKQSKYLDWDDLANRAFEIVTRKITSPDVLKLPDTSKPFILTTDASGIALGVVLTQFDENNIERVCAYGGRQFREIEVRNMSVPEKELTAILHGIKTYHYYLTNTKFTIRTDARSLVFIKKFKACNNKIAQIAYGLQDYDFDIIHMSKKSGNTIAICDYISRAYQNKVKLVGYKTLKHPSINEWPTMELPEKIMEMKELDEKIDEYITTLPEIPTVVECNINVAEFLDEKEEPNRRIKWTNKTRENRAENILAVALTDACLSIEEMKFAQENDRYCKQIKITSACV